MKSVLFAILLIFSITLLAEPVDSTEAKIIAANFYQYKNQKRSWANVKKTIVMQYKGINTRYTFVFANNDFVIVSADNATVPVFAYSENGSYNNEDKPPAYEYWMQTEYDEWVYYVRQNNISNAETIEQWNNIKTNNFSQYRSNSSVDPLIETRWGQSFTNDGVCPGYNFFVQNNNNCGCDHCTAGCVAVAMAQIMNFWRSPDNDFDWCNMPNLLNRMDYKLPRPYIRANYETERNAIAELIADCGDKSDIKYCRKIDKETSCRSRTSTGKAKRALRNDYKYSNDMLHRYRCLTMSWKPKMRKSLDNRQPILYSGSKPNGGNGHAFVCDGYKDDDYFHFNWGWRGTNDAYFYIKDNDGSPVIDYYKWQEAVFYLHPEIYSTVNCIDCNKSITISNVVVSHNPFNSEFPYIDWTGLSSFYNYRYSLPLSSKPKASNIITINGETRLEYYDITDGTIHTDNVVIPNKVNVHFKAYNKIILKKFETEKGAEFTAVIIPCPNINRSFNNRESTNIHKPEIVHLNDHFEKFSNITVSKTDSMSISNNNELKIVNEKFKDNFSIHPNPSKGLFTVDYSISKISEVIIQIMDMNGVLLKEYIKYNNPGNYSEHFDISQLSSGIYLCSIKTSTFTKTIKLIIY